MTLAHTERFELAQSLCERLLAKYPGQVILCGLYGSTAQGTDTPWSDLEMWVVVQDGCPAQGQNLVFRDTAVGYRVYMKSELERILETPSMQWAFHMGVLSVIKVLSGDLAQVQAWLTIGKSVPPEKFRVTLEEVLPGLVIESYGRIRSCMARADLHNLAPSIWEVLFEMLAALCLLNRSWVTHDYYQGLVDSFRFARLPEGYPEIIPQLYETRDVKQAAFLSEKLFENFLKLLMEEKIGIKNYQSVEEIPL